MKKIIYMAGAALALMSMSACSGNGGGSTCSDGKCDSKCKEDMLYTGVLPAADAPGVRYALTLDYDDDKGCKEGDYDLVETYLTADSTSVAGVADGVTYKSEGDFTVFEKNGKKYIKLVKDAKDSNPNASDNLYFELSSDSTLTMVNSSLEPSVNTELNYTLTLAK